MIERNRAAFPMRAGMMYVERPMQNIVGATVENSVACQLGYISALDING